MRQPRYVTLPCTQPLSPRENHSNSSLITKYTRIQILWYNKSRAVARICPVCKRLYRVGDTDALTDIDSDAPASPTATATDVALNAERRRREQEISGICTFLPSLPFHSSLHSTNAHAHGPGSSLCFLLAAHRRFPSALRQLWGHMAHDAPLAHLDPDVLAFDDMKPSQITEGADNPLGLSLLLQMTRFHDLGLQALLFGGRDVGEGGEGEEEGAEDGERKNGDDGEEHALELVEEECEDEADQEAEDAALPTVPGEAHGIDAS